MGGSGQTSWLDTTKYSSSSNVTTSTASQVTLTNTEKFSNTGFESNLTGWNTGAQPDSISGLQLWLKANAITGLNDGDSVTTWTDSSTSNNNATQSTSSNKPTYKTNVINNQPVVRFNGSTNLLTTNASVFNFSESASIFVVTSNVSITGQHGVIGSNNGSHSDKGVIYYRNEANKQITYTSYPAEQRIGTIINPQIVTVVEGTGLYQNGSFLIAVTTKPANTNTINLGFQAALTMPMYLSGDIAEVVVYNSALSSSNRSRIENFLRDKYNITVSSGITSVTRDTSTKYAGIASVKLVTSSTDTGEFTQSVNVGDTNSYNLSAYAYTTGAAVTSSDVELFYNGSTVATAYTQVGSTGWYKLTGTITGANASRQYGVQGKNNKTLYIDDLSLNNYSSPGTLTSSIFDSGQGSNWETLTYAATTPSNTSVSVKVRSGNQADLSDATAFTSCSAISSGSTVGGTTCATNNQRYVQYQLSLANTDSVSTPTFTSFSLAFTVSDTTPPSISLTVLSPDPNNDNTPTLTGSATDTGGIVSNVQYQMDGTSGSWTACTADDGSFDEATETFTCTPSALSDGSHTMYVRATDSNSNTTASGSESSDTFTIDATAPTSIDLDSPGDNSYTSSERPTFKWKATSDATAGLSKYVLEIDNPSAGSGQASGDFTIDSIPTSRTTDYETNKYIIHYENFSDSDSTNNYISIYTKSSSEWSTDSNSGQNDGKLREGKVSWKVKARDNVGNETSSSRTLFVDRTSPKVEFIQVNDTPFTSSNFSTTDKSPTIYGKITDSLAGGDSSQTQDENGPKIASGPKQVEIKVEKKEGLTYKLHILYTINMDTSTGSVQAKPWYTCDGKEVYDNSEQKCDKYLPFEYTPKDTLDFGAYKITLSGKDKADNASSETSFTLNITTLARVTTPEERKIIEEGIKELPKEEQEKVKEELEITKPVEPSALDKAGEQISQTSKNILNTTGNFIGSIFNGIGQGVKFTIDTTGKALALVGKTSGNIASALYNGTKLALAYVGQGIGNGARAVGQGLAFVGQKASQGISTVAQGMGNLLASIGDGYNQLANNAPGVVKTILTGIGNGVSATVSTLASATNAVVTTTTTLAQNTASAFGNTISSLVETTGMIAQNTRNAISITTNAVVTTTTTVVKNTSSAIASATQKTVNNAKEGISNVAFKVGEKTQDVSDPAGLAIIKFTYNFVSTPTTIADVQVAVFSPTSVKVSWQTNHPANGKVNYGLDRTYPFDVQSERRVTHHEVTLNDLKPDTLYYFEVMSHNKNYVYDANREFRTPPEK